MTLPPHGAGGSSRALPADLDALALLDAAPDAMIVVDAAGLIRLVNAQAEVLFGYGRDELIGAPLEVLIPEGARADHSQHLARYLHAPTTRAMGASMQLRGRRKDALEIHVEVSLSPVPSSGGLYVCAAVRDVAERRRMEREARLSAARLTSAVESIEDALALYDDEDRLVLCNSAYRMLVGASVTGAIVGASFETLLDAWLPSLDLADEEARRAHRAERLSMRGERRATIDVRTSDDRRLRVMNRHTDEGGFVETIWDLTEDMRLAEDLRDARATAESASLAKSEFLSAMSHELRTPLNAILGFAQLLHRDRREPLSQRHRERTEHILKGGQHLLRLIDEILDLSRIEAGRATISMEPVGVAEVVREVATTLASMAARHGTELTVAEHGLEEGRVLADRVRLRQVLLNFGSNAIKYGREGGRARIQIAARGEFLRVSVEDDGAGIAEEHQARLFEPFFRAGQEFGAIEGTGIGLSLCKRLAELMGGQVGFVSELGRGSTFWIELPADRRSERPSPAGIRASRSGESRLSSAGERAPHLVLYVEDNPSNIAFMLDLLEDFEGVELITAPTAEAGLELVRRERPRAVIMDINLPGMSGLEATRVLKSSPDTRGIPVIALSAAATERDAKRAAGIGFYRYLTKPVELDKLVRALEEVLLDNQMGPPRRSDEGAT